MIDFIKYSLWPAVKVKLTYWWWVIKYQGKKNIPPELIFGKMSESMNRMQDGLLQALRHSPDDISEEEKQELLKLLRLADSLEKEINQAKTENQEK
ncbi:MAG: hypothetical protein AB1721_01465 [Patescibacteria group bacterium]